MKIVFADRGWEDFTYWVESDRKIAARIVRLIEDIEREPFDGLGKPEPLRHDLTGFVPVRITPGPRGEQLAQPTPLNTSGDFAGLTATDGFVELPAGRDEVSAGTAVGFWPWV